MIEWNKKNTILAQITNLKKDRKFTVRVLKNGNLVGITELVIPQMFLLKREENFSKQISISMTEQMKRALMGKETKSMQIVVKAKVEYKEDGGNVQRSSSATPISSSATKNSVSSVKKQSSNNTSTVSSNQKASVYVKDNYKINDRGSIYVIKDKHEKPQMMQVDEFGEVDKSFIDSIFGDDHIADFDQIDKSVNDFIADFNIEAKESAQAPDVDTLKAKSKALLPKLFDLQKVYYSQFNNALKVNRRLKELLVKYNEKHRTMVKKNHRLKEALESNLIRNELTSFINKEENKGIDNALSLNRFELDIFKKLFKIDYTGKDVKKFADARNANTEEEEKKTLLKVLENLCKNQDLFNRIPEEKRIHLSYLTSKYGVNISNRLEEAMIEEQDEGLEAESTVKNHNAELDGESDLRLDIIKKKLSFVNSDISDILDHKIDDFLVDLYTKKRISQIPFKRLSQGEYEYGSQKVFVEADGKNFKGKNRSLIVSTLIPLNTFSSCWWKCYSPRQIH